MVRIHCNREFLGAVLTFDAIGAVVSCIGLLNHTEAVRVERSFTCRAFKQVLSSFADKAELAARAVPFLVAVHELWNDVAF